MFMYLFLYLLLLFFHTLWDMLLKFVNYVYQSIVMDHILCKNNSLVSEIAPSIIMHASIFFG